MEGGRFGEKDGDMKRRVGAIIQARMDSKRLPGKVLMPILGKPVLWHIARRLKYSALIDETVISTSSEEDDQPIIVMARENDIPCYAGSKLDLVDRFYQTARSFGFDVIVRIAADRPLIDPHIVDRAISAYLESGSQYQYVTNSLPDPTFPLGLDVEVFGFETLQKLWKEISPGEKREWFTT